MSDLRETIAKISTGSKSLFLPPALLQLAPGDHAPILPSPGESFAACTDPKNFYPLQRTSLFDTVFLSPGSFCAPLRDQLLTSQVWVLSDVLPEGYLFRAAGSSPWHPPSASEASLLQPEPERRSLWLSGIAENLVAIGRNGDAATLLELAAGSKEGEARRLTVLASLESNRGHWRRAVELARSALMINRSERGARIILIRALAETGRTDEARAEARDLVNSVADAETLFLLARADNAAGDHAGEIDALRRLVATGRKTGQPVGASLLYLGQALGHDGKQGEALRALDEAAQSPELTGEQRRLIMTLRDHLAPERSDPR